MHMQSNLDTQFVHMTCDIHCGCLPAVWIEPNPAGTGIVMHLYHDATVARVLRSEDGHP